MDAKKNEERLDRIDKNLDVLAQFVMGSPNTPGLVTRVDRLEVDSERRRFHIRTLWAALLAGAAKFGFDHFR